MGSDPLAGTLGAGGPDDLQGRPPFGIPLITNIQLAQRFVDTLSKKRVAELQINSWQEQAPSWCKAAA
jgi:hypothetical protein